MLLCKTASCLALFGIATPPVIPRCFWCKFLKYPGTCYAYEYGTHIHIIDEISANKARKLPRGKIARLPVGIYGESASQRCLFYQLLPIRVQLETISATCQASPKVPQ
jgi:hypothetical protein